MSERMKKQIGIFSLLGFACILIIFFVSTSRKAPAILPLTAFESNVVRVGKASFTVFIADTPQRKAQGLMYVRELPPDRGMLFIFEKSQILSFYNKNTLIPLDILWIKNGIVEELSSLPAIKDGNIVFITSHQPADRVIELNAGSAMRNNISVGDKIE